MGNIVFELESLYQQTFGTKPQIIKQSFTEDVPEPFKIAQKKDAVLYTQSGAPLIATDLKGVEIWLPVYLYNLPAEIGENGRLFLPYSVVRISGGNPNWIKTPLSERIGSLKEFYSTDDYKISIKGFFIDKERRLFPEKDLLALKKINELGQSFSIWNAITDIFLSQQSSASNIYEQQQVVFTGFELPEVEGGRKHVRPFSMSLESDNIFTLEVE